MKIIAILTGILLFPCTATLADENSDIIVKAMEDGLKGKTSLIKKTLGGEASDEEIKKLAQIVGTLKGTQSPVGDQADYEKKVAALIAAAETVAGGDKGDTAMAALKEASNCKACHNLHKP